MKRNSFNATKGIFITSWQTPGEEKEEKVKSVYTKHLNEMVASDCNSNNDLKLSSELMNQVSLISHFSVFKRIEWIKMHSKRIVLPTSICNINYP